MNILSIDFDFFFPTPAPGHDPMALYDWGTREAPFFITDIWPIRAATFLASDLPLPPISDEWRDFWRRFTFSPDARLYTSESHVHMISRQIFRKPRQATIVNYDAHHDLGYNGPATKITDYVVEVEWDCANWGALWALKGARIVVRYPRWRSWAMQQEPQPLLWMVNAKRTIDDGKPDTRVFDAVFLCRSGSWVPSWHDAAYNAFLAECPVRKRTVLLPLLDREFSLEHAQNEANKLTLMRQAIR